MPVKLKVVDLVVSAKFDSHNIRCCVLLLLLLLCDTECIVTTWPTALCLVLLCHRVNGDVLLPLPTWLEKL